MCYLINGSERAFNRGRLNCYYGFPFTKDQNKSFWMSAINTLASIGISGRTNNNWPRSKTAARWWHGARRDKPTSRPSVAVASSAPTPASRAMSYLFRRQRDRCPIKRGEGSVSSVFCRPIILNNNHRRPLLMRSFIRSDIYIYMTRVLPYIISTIGHKQTS